MRKILLLIFIFFLLVPFVTAIDVGVNVTPSTTTTSTTTVPTTTSTTTSSTTSTTTTTIPSGHPLSGMSAMVNTINLTMSAGGLMFLIATFIGGTPPEDKIKLVFSGVIVMLFIITAITLLQGML